MNLIYFLSKPVVQSLLNLENNDEQRFLKNGKHAILIYC
jgi:hypothetical protein